MDLTATGRNASANGFVDLLNLGKIVFHTAGHVEVATCIFGNPAFGDAVAGVATANAITADADATGGVIDHAHILKADLTDMAELSVGVGAGDIQMPTLTIPAGATVSINAGGTITQPE